MRQVLLALHDHSLILLPALLLALPLLPQALLGFLTLLLGGNTLPLRLHGAGDLRLSRVRLGRHRRVDRVVTRLKPKRDEIINVLMWEICKTKADATKEFDRTMDFIAQAIAALKADPVKHSELAEHNAAADARYREFVCEQVQSGAVEPRGACEALLGTATRRNSYSPMLVD